MKDSDIKIADTVEADGGILIIRRNTYDYESDEAIFSLVAYATSKSFWFQRLWVGIVYRACVIAESIAYGVSFFSKSLAKRLVYFGKKYPLSMRDMPKIERNLFNWGREERT